MTMSLCDVLLLHWPSKVLMSVSKSRPEFNLCMILRIRNL